MDVRLFWKEFDSFDEREFRNLINKANADHGDVEMKITSIDNIEKAKVIFGYPDKYAIRRNRTRR